MKKLLTVICLCLCLASCHASSIDQLNSIKNSFKQDVSVCVLSAGKGEYLVKDLDEVLWFVKVEIRRGYIVLPTICTKYEVKFNIYLKKEIIEIKER